MTYQLIRGDATSLPLADDSVDLIGTSPPSDADAVEFLRTQVQRLHLVGECGVPAGSASTFRPHRQERLRDEHLPRPGSDVRNRPIPNSLDHGPVVAAGAPRHLRHVAHALGRHGIGIDLSADYLRLADWRCNDPVLRAKVLRVEKPPAQVEGQASLFGDSA